MIRQALCLSLPLSHLNIFSYSTHLIFLSLSRSLALSAAGQTTFHESASVSLALSAAAHGNGNVVALGSSRKWVSGLSVVQWIVCPPPSPLSSQLCFVMHCLRRFCCLFFASHQPVGVSASNASSFFANIQCTRIMKHFLSAIAVAVAIAVVLYAKWLYICFYKSSSHHC